MNFAGHRLGPRPGSEAESLPQDPARRALATVENLLLDPDDHFYGGGREVHAAGPRRADDPDLEPQPLRLPLRAGVQEHPPPRRDARVRPLRGRAHRGHVPPGQPLEPDVHRRGRRARARLLRPGRHAQGDPGAYTDLTGKPAGAPEWAFGLWASTCFVKFTEASVLAQARRLRAEGIPCDVFHLDSFWQRAFMWCDFEWDAERLPDPKRLLAELHREGFHNCLWINPYVSLQSALYQEGAAGGYFLRRPDGTVYDALVWSQRTERGMGLCAIVDFTNPEAVRWYRGKLEAQLALGADSFKPDFAEEIPEDARFANGLTGAEMHNPYPLLYQRECFEATQATTGAARSPGHAARRRGSSAIPATGRATRSARSWTWPARCAAGSRRP